MNNLTVKTANYPYSVGWAITNICNLHCIHCNMDSGIGLKNELNTEECFKIIDELRENNVQKICFFGGEPFARKDFLKIVDYAFNSMDSTKTITVHSRYLYNTRNNWRGNANVVLDLN